jgi:hypothetical protein
MAFNKNKWLHNLFELSLLLAMLVAIVVMYAQNADDAYEINQSILKSSSKAGTSGRLFKMERLHSREETTASSIERWKKGGANAVTLKAPLLDEEGKPFPMCEYWVVITSINLPTTTVEKLLQVSDICICVVADKKSPAEYITSESLVYLTPNMQVNI